VVFWRFVDRAFGTCGGCIMDGGDWKRTQPGVLDTWVVVAGTSSGRPRSSRRHGAGKISSRSMSPHDAAVRSSMHRGCMVTKYAQSAYTQLLPSYAIRNCNNSIATNSLAPNAATSTGALSVWAWAPKTCRVIRAGNDWTHARPT
jgi:hypothetical protein